MWWKNSGAIAVIAAGMWGCAGGAGLGEKALKPRDFEAGRGDEPAARVTAERIAEASAASNEAPKATSEAPGSDPKPSEKLPDQTARVLGSTVRSRGPGSDSRDLIVDAMVGQIRGKPVYAGEVFKEIGDAELVRLGQTLSRGEFRQRAYELIDKTLAQWLYNRLELTEAERSLTERERQSLPGMRHLHREKIIAKWGAGVPALADQKLKERFGYNVEELVEQYIQSQVIYMHREKKIKPRVHVDRWQVDRYYRDHPLEFNPAPAATVRVILVRDASAADAVDRDLAAGSDFAQVAARYSAVRREDGGLLPAFGLKGPFAQFNELNWKELNEKVRRLKVGQHSDRTAIGESFGWVMLEDLKESKPKALEEVFLEIEKMLRQEKEKKLQREMMRDLLAKRNYTPHEEMREALIEVAMVRYAKAQ